MTFHYEKPSRAKMISHDLCRTLIHECGHLIVGDHVGVEKSFAEFWLYEDVDPETEHLVGGRTSHSPPLYGRENQLMGVAGFVAECITLDDGSYGGDWLQLLKLGLGGGFSDTDRGAAGEVDADLLDECGDILMQHWPDLINEALHFLGQFEVENSDDTDVAKAVPIVRLELEGMRNRFKLVAA